MCLNVLQITKFWLSVIGMVLLLLTNMIHCLLLMAVFHLENNLLRLILRQLRLDIGLLRPESKRLRLGITLRLLEIIHCLMVIKILQ